MRYFKEARIRIHGDEAEGAKYVSLARTLLGSLITRDGEIGGLEQSVYNATIGDADIRVSFNSWMPTIDIWVGKEEEKWPCFPQFGAAGKRRLQGVEEIANVAACEYMDSYFDLSLTGGVYLGPYKSAYFTPTDNFPRTQTQVVYPAHTPNISVTPHSYNWWVFELYQNMAIGTPFGADIQARGTFVATYRAPTFPGDGISAGGEPLGQSSYYNWPRVQGLRTDPNGDKIVLVYTQAIISGLNVDPSGTAQPVPIIGVYNLTTGVTLKTVILPVLSFSLSPVPGLVYMTSGSIVVGDTNYYILCMSYSGYAIRDSVPTDVAKFEATVLYTLDDGATFNRVNIRQFIEPYVDLVRESQYTTPVLRFENRLQRTLQIAAVSAKFLAIGDNEALLRLYLTKADDRVVNGVFYFGMLSTGIILKCTPTGVSEVYRSTAWRGFPAPTAPPGTPLIEEELNVLQYWVYLGNDVILGKFIAGIVGIDRATRYMRSFDRGDTWEEVPATGLPSFRMNQFFGDFTLIEPYEVDEDGDVISAGVVLTTAYDSGVYRSYVSTDVGETWVEAGALSNTEEFYRVDSILVGDILVGDGGNNFHKISYFGDIGDPAPFNPALPELMRRPQP